MFFEESLMRLRGTRQGSIYAPGDKLTVMLKEVNFISQETKWYITSKEKRAATKEVKRPKKQTSGKALNKKWSKKKTGKTRSKKGKKS